MAHFRGIIQGQLGEASRLGTKASGLSARLGSWQGGITVNIYHDPIRPEGGRDRVRIAFCQWDNGAGSNREIYDGPISGQER